MILSVLLTSICLCFYITRCYSLCYCCMRESCQSGLPLFLTTMFSFYKKTNHSLVEIYFSAFHMCVHMHMEARDQRLAVGSLLGVSQLPWIRLGGLASHPQVSLSPLHLAGIPGQGFCHQTDFLCGFWELNLSPHACTLLID